MRAQGMNRSVMVSLPWPPSLNRVWRSVGGKVLLAKEARIYREQVGNEVLIQRVPRLFLSGRLSLEIMAHPPDARARDLDNLLKAPLDALKCAGVLADDRHIDDLHIRRGKVTSKGRLTIRITEIDHADAG